MPYPGKFGHAMAIFGSLAIHAGFVAWVLQPSPPIAIPQQQVIQIAMIAPAPQKKNESQAETPKPIPPKPIGMKQQQEWKEPKELSRIAPSSGPQAADADARNAALTPPLFDAVYLRNPPPAYPSAARRRHIEGKVLLKVEVSSEGVAEHVEIAHSSGSGLLDEAAREAVEQWRFIPARRGSTRIAADVIVPIIFRIEENG